MELKTTFQGIPIVSAQQGRRKFGAVRVLPDPHPSLLPEDHAKRVRRFAEHGGDRQHGACGGKALEC